MSADIEYDIDDERGCPKCGHDRVHYRGCTELDCNEGFVDMSEEDYLIEGSNMIMCKECKGTGTETWCPNCGTNLSGFQDEENEN